MHLSAWLFWTACLCTWVEASGRCQCRCTCSPEEQQLQVGQGSERSEGRRRDHRRLAHERPSRKDRGHRRKAPPPALRFAAWIGCWSLITFTSSDQREWNAAANPSAGGRGFAENGCGKKELLGVYRGVSRIRMAPRLT
ncbi:hypothetical protein AOLI_G00222960 [Acnodon oligacanthus]